MSYFLPPFQNEVECKAFLCQSFVGPRFEMEIEGNSKKSLMYVYCKRKPWIKGRFHIRNNPN